MSLAGCLGGAWGGGLEEKQKPQVALSLIVHPLILQLPYQGIVLILRNLSKLESSKHVPRRRKSLIRALNVNPEGPAICYV
jgi:hypothetical protein